MTRTPRAASVLATSTKSLSKNCPSSMPTTSVAGSTSSRISAAVRTASEIRALVDPSTEVVGIDEGQFFDSDLVAVVNELADRGVRVIIAGLDQDYTGRPFEPMPQLLAVAEYITKTHAICVRCGQPANYSQRTVNVEGQVVVGASDAYEARCRACFVPHADAPTRYVAE